MLALAQLPIAQRATPDVQLQVLDFGATRRAEIVVMRIVSLTQQEFEQSHGQASFEEIVPTLARRMGRTLPGWAMRQRGRRTARRRFLSMRVMLTASA